MHIVRMYFRNTAPVAWIYWTAYLSTLTATHVLINGQVCTLTTSIFPSFRGSDIIAQTYFLGYWAAQYEDHEPSEVSVP